MRINSKFAGRKIARMNKPLPKWLNWEHIEMNSLQEGRRVVKGTNKRVVVVKSPDPKIFEQAIFIIREGGKESSDSSSALRQAQRVADDYVKNYVSGSRNIFARIPPAAYAGIGALATAAAWLIMDIVK